MLETGAFPGVGRRFGVPAGPTILVALAVDCSRMGPR